jgi:hypothetical protein
VPWDFEVLAFSQLVCQEPPSFDFQPPLLELISALAITSKTTKKRNGVNDVHTQYNTFDSNRL